MQAEEAGNEANGFPLDTRGRAITPARLHRAMNLNIMVGAMGMAWFVACSPQQIMTVFYKNELLAGDPNAATRLGWMVALMQMAAACNLIAMFIYSRTTNRKGVWVTAHVLHRLFGFVLAGVAVMAAQGGNKDLGAKIIAGGLVVSWILTSSTASGWWSWMADLVPEGIRASFFTRRNAIIRALNMAWFFACTFALDHFNIVNIYYVYAAIFALGATLGVLDILIHGTIPEPRRVGDSPPIRWKEFTEPLRNRNFLSFCLAIGTWNFANCVLGPFIAPYITADVDKGGIGAPMTWLGINGNITQAVMIVTGTAWGVIMDRFGRKPVVLLGALHPIIPLVACFFLTPSNYPFLLIASALLTGILAPAFWDGAGQLMLTLTPQRNRNAYLSWHMALGGVIAAGGSILGGWLSDHLRDFHYELWQGFTLGSFHMVALAALVLSLISQAMLHRIREGREKPVGYVVSRLFTPGIIRTFLNIGAITSAASSDRATRALRSMSSGSDHLAVADIAGRMHDPDPQVREEAARALGRIGSADAVDPLIDRLRDPASTIRPEAAQALGLIGDPRAVPVLIECISCPAAEVQDACARALEAIRTPHARSRRTVRRLREIRQPAGDMTVATITSRLDDPDPDVREEAARALGRIESPEAVEALVQRLRDPASTIRFEAAQALGQIGDARAVPALAECLRDESAEIQDACARALGDIGGRESVRHLLRLLEEKHPERVIASGAEAVSRLGVIEAAWEIFPHMHETANPILRAQLAIAMGNVLGRPGEFYAYVAGDTARGGARVGKLFRRADRTLRSLRKTCPKKSPHRARLDELQDELERVRGLMEGHSFRAAIEALAAIVRGMVMVAIDRDCSDELALEYALAHNVRLGLGFWFAREIKQRLGTTHDSELLQTDALLILYFLSAYRARPEPTALRTM